MEIKALERKRIILYVGICCLLSVLACLSYLHIRKRMLKVAEQTFVYAVGLDLDKRWKKQEVPMIFYPGKRKSEYSKLTVVTDSLQDKSYSLQEVDYDVNVDKEFYRRIFHTEMAEGGHPICPDSLNLIWQEQMQGSVGSCKSAVVVGYTGYDVAKVCDSLSTAYHMLPVYYAGVRNEIRLNGFVRFSVFDVFRLQPLLWIYICLLLVGVVYVVWKVVVGKAVSKPVEKGTFCLAENIVYHPNARCFVRGAEKIMLSPKSNLIIKALLEAENYRMHGADLLAEVWNTNETNMNKLYIQNSKLRTVLQGLGDGFDIVSIEKGFFRLVFPYSGRDDVKR